MYGQIPILVQGRGWMSLGRAGYGDRGWMRSEAIALLPTSSIDVQEASIAGRHRRCGSDLEEQMMMADVMGSCMAPLAKKIQDPENQAIISTSTAAVPRLCSSVRHARASHLLSPEIAKNAQPFIYHDVNQLQRMYR